jgi:radical SAM protein with 4Fe4S-binding SPASM domain
MTVKGFYDKGYDYNARAPYFIERSELTEEEYRKLTHSETFCMLPWMHMHAFPDGRVYPCCLAEYFHPVGDLRKNTMREVWNQPKYKAMRVNMMADKPCVECTKCYEQERHGAFSMRNDANRNYGHMIKEVNQTHADGTHDEFKIRYWDVRFSNLCNFR